MKMSTCKALTEMVNNDAGFENNTESLWDAIKKDLGENCLEEKSCSVSEEPKRRPADGDSTAQNQDLEDVCSRSKLPLNSNILNDNAEEVVRETRQISSAWDINTTNLCNTSLVLTGNEAVSGEEKKSDGRERFAKVHPLCSLQSGNVIAQYPPNYNQRTPEHLNMLFGVTKPATAEKAEILKETQGAGMRVRPMTLEKTQVNKHVSTPLGNYPIGYNQRTPEHLHWLFGAVKTTNNEEIAVKTALSENTQRDKLSNKKARSKKHVPKILGNYPKDYNKRTKEHLHFLFGAKSQLQTKNKHGMENQSSTKGRKIKDKKNKNKNTNKQKKMNNHNDKGQQTSSTSYHSEDEPKTVQKKTGLLGFLRNGRSKKHA